mmetsp:Transcript_28992/g.43804  ORF Transcript_28992/g.43804 Transcript_28992/m.43804 type:complete len:175 (+) Transcript_28992:134-658(+)
MMQIQYFLALLFLMSETSAFNAPRVREISLVSVTSSNAAIPDMGKEIEDDPRNPDNPDLPELKNNFDWDEKFGNDDDWETDPTKIPGKMVLNEIELAAQVAALDELEEKWSKIRDKQEYNDARILGWTERAETYNGRYAMFFLAVGLLTEYWTGVSMPGQVEEILRLLGILGFD